MDYDPDNKSVSQGGAIPLTGSGSLSLNGGEESDHAHPGLDWSRAFIPILHARYRFLRAVVPPVKRE